VKILSRDFSRGEKIILIILAIVLVGLVYYQFVDKAVRESIEKANAEAEAIKVELTTVNAKIKRMEEMQAELDSITSDPNASYMGSYNNSKEEIAFLNDVLSNALQYSISFSNVTRDGDQIRRNFSLQFTTSDFSGMEKVMKQLCDGKLRCLINDISYSITRYNYSAAEREEYGVDYYERVNLNCTATFFETMVGGTEDAGLPTQKVS
jgi:beta-glucosidase/6-phospho-beta-glucosidase/beta-galactosidase